MSAEKFHTADKSPWALRKLGGMVELPPRELRALIGGSFSCLHAGFAVTRAIILGVRLRTGDRAIIAGACAIAVYEYAVRDDEDLISRRVAAYRTKPLGRLVTDAVILATALHLSQAVNDEFDIYHHAMLILRRTASRSSKLEQ